MSWFTPGLYSPLFTLLCSRADILEHCDVMPKEIIMTNTSKIWIKCCTELLVAITRQVSIGILDVRAELIQCYRQTVLINLLEVRTIIILLYLYNTHILPSFCTKTP